MNRKKGLKLFTPVQLGSLNLKHRVVMAPLTRSRSEQPGGIPGDMMVQYYSDRASDGGLIVGEATNISLTARGWYGAPGLYTDQQVEGWKGVVKAIHAKNGFVFAQLWHNLCHLSCRYQCTHGNEAPVARCKSGAKPKIKEQEVGRVLHEPW